MHIAERTEGDFRVYASADPAPPGGFFAGCVVTRRPPPRSPAVEIFRDERLDDGRTWDDPSQALSFALEVGVAAIHAQAWLQSWQETSLASVTQRITVSRQRRFD